MTRRNWMLIALAAGAIAVAPTRAHALSGCANNLLNGSYAMQFSGTAQSSRLSGFARLIFDADGNVQGYSAVNGGGALQKRDVTGVYTVNDDCTVTFSLTDTAGTTRNFAGVIASQGASMLVLQTDPGVEISASLSRARAFCQPSDLTGSFGLQYQGVTSDQAQSAFTSVGLINIDADGNVTASELRSSAGTSAQVASAGTLLVDSDCTAALTLAPVTGTAAPVSFQGMVAADGRSAVLAGSDAGKSATGTITAQ